MRGYLVLHLLGEKIARDMQADGADGTSVTEWYRVWTETLESGMYASPGSSDVTASLLMYRLKVRDQIRTTSFEHDDE